MFLCSLRYCLKCYFSKGVYSFTLSTVYIYILLFSLTKTSLHACCEIYILNEKLQTSVYNFERFLFLLFGLLLNGLLNDLVIITIYIYIFNLKCSPMIICPKMLIILQLYPGSIYLL